VYEYVLLREGHPRARAWGCSQTFGERMSTTTLFWFRSFFSLFCRKKIKNHGNMGTYEIWELPQHNALGFFCWGRLLKIHIETKRELFTSEDYYGCFFSHVTMAKVFANCAGCRFCCTPPKRVSEQVHEHSPEVFSCSRRGSLIITTLSVFVGQITFSNQKEPGSMQCNSLIVGALPYT
jgi:hypothetical protein